MLKKEYVLNKQLVESLPVFSPAGREAKKPSASVVDVHGVDLPIPLVAGLSGK